MESEIHPFKNLGPEYDELVKEYSNLLRQKRAKEEEMEQLLRKNY